MVCQSLYLGTYRWRLVVFYDTTKQDAEEILECLYDIGCDNSTIDKARINLSESHKNTGLTFSNYESRESIMVLSKTTSECEFSNSWFHEVIHVAVHIASADGISCDTEYTAYVGGYVAMRMQPVASAFMCHKCHKAAE